jgi:hypothetical protein
VGLDACFDIAGEVIVDDRLRTPRFQFGDYFGDWATRVED